MKTQKHDKKMRRSSSQPNATSRTTPEGELALPCSQVMLNISQKNESSKIENLSVISQISKIKKKK